MLWIPIVAAAVLILFLIVVLAAASKIFDVAVNAKRTKEKVFKTNANKSADGMANKKTEKELANEWLNTQEFTMHSQCSQDGLRLVARELASERPSHLWAVCIHGFSGNGLKLGLAAKHWHEQGWNVLLPDLRGSGGSEGDYYGMGWLDRHDIIGWIRGTILGKDPEAQIVLHGVSMGAATVMMATGEPLPENVRAAVEDCGYTDVWEEFTIQLKKVFGLPQFPIMHIANGMAKRRAGYSFQEASSVRQVKKSKTPTLFIHGDADTFVPFFMLDEVYEAAACEKEKLVVHGAQHGESVQLEPQRYWDAVHAFVGKYLD
ncbi:alpha/beta hydrolase [Christensenella tenuis]|uniref:Alpha/beta hydrolase n=1 Tax=Christensenella tenuis TaxID=2763033 RepID=A0ABR7ED63_9FIRM|nr:alpha/beta hydrolase [Christensenella tenuis]MBC5647722.1 alpha/beta hydrolase [Christensenella tenuis]